MRLAGKRALVTAAGQGIGRAVAQAFAREGAQVLATDINADSLTDLAGDRLSTRVLDVTDPRALQAVAGDHAEPGSAFNVLFNCAGIVHAGTLLDCTNEQLDAAWRLNVGGMFNVCRALLPAMIAAGGGSIINISSIASSLKAVPNRFAYSTTKAAVIGFTKSVAMDFIGKGVRCNAICPGTVETPSLLDRIATQARAQQVDVDDVHEQFVARQPMGRLGTPAEIAALAVYLASDESAFTTGAVHVIDGGWCN
ncbi:2-keto-3-deoxy-L-fuconate dehydrogenase [Povalibacter uvarum]|uniref:2-keto-3-deoxy-L-fuconate dehydrogenase n=1 Tax=Povalibacter uvarum TaxID=732238 RepID=A0A841HS16_9GAMM|nr:SDR family oxidoreductase [Povalibacter uvarum]MBB6094858.1 2-keto-3-deoxy-L-fuconate dehydrogenase [Povalibacter uvarum]